MRDHHISLDAGPTAESTILHVFPDGVDADANPNAGRLAVTIVEADGDTAPAPAGPVTIKLFRDGSYTVESDR